MSEELPERLEALLNFLFNEGGPVPFGKIVREIVSKFDVSPSAVQKDLRTLQGLGLVEKADKGLYKITKSGMSYLGVRPPGLYYECTEKALLEALKLTQRISDQKVKDELYMKIIDALDCLRDLGRMYKKEWDIEIPLD